MTPSQARCRVRSSAGEVLVELCWLETKTKPNGTKWIDINVGNRSEIRPRLVGNRAEEASHRDRHLARGRLPRNTTFGSTATLDEFDDDLEQGSQDAQTDVH